MDAIKSILFGLLVFVGVFAWFAVPLWLFGDSGWMVSLFIPAVIFFAWLTGETFRDPKGW